MQKYIECPFCEDIYGTNESDVHAPKILKCGHTLYKECLEKEIKKNDKEIFNCPKCNKEIKKEQNIDEYTTNIGIIDQINELFNIDSIDDKDDEKNEAIKYRVILLGNCAVGKTSILKRLSNNKFDSNCFTTVGCETSIYYMKYKNIKYQLLFFDTGGQEKYKAITRNYLRNVDGVLFVFDISDKKSFEDISFWYNFYKEENENVVGLLIGNKCDLKHKVGINESEEFAKEHGLLYIETSASSDKNIKKAIVCLLKKINGAKKYFESTSSVDTAYFSIQKNEEPKKKKCRC